MEQRDYVRAGWQLILDEADMRELMKTYHFESSQRDVLERVYQSLQKEMQPEADLRFADEKVCSEIPFIGEEHSIIGTVTLGDGIDKLLQTYYQANRVLEAYAADCLSMELLRKGYTQFEQLVHAECGQWPEKYEFIGDKYPLDTIPQLLSCLPETAIRANSAYALFPGKSVLFVAGLSKERKGCALRLCEECDAKHCANKKRARNYGEMQIFGIRDRIIPPRLWAAEKGR